MPSDAAGAAQFGADSPVIGSQQQEDGIGAAVGIELAGLNERFQERVRQMALLDQIASDTADLAGGRRGKRQARLERFRFGFERLRDREALHKPPDGATKVRGVQIHRQVDGAPAAAPLVPGDELHAVDGEYAVGGVPFHRIATICLGPGGAQNGSQRMLRRRSVRIRRS